MSVALSIRTGNSGNRVGACVQSADWDDFEEGEEHSASVVFDARQPIMVDANEDEDDCLAAAAEAYVEDHPELEGCDLDPEWDDVVERTKVRLWVPLEHAIKVG